MLRGGQIQSEAQVAFYIVQAWVSWRIGDLYYGFDLKCLIVSY